MTGVPQLREALELWESYLAGIHDCNLEEPEAVAVLHINAAARCLVEVAETSQEMWLCREEDHAHDWSDGFEGDPHCWYNGLGKHNPECGLYRLVDPQLLECE